MTPRENVLRGISFAAANALKTRCVNGHPFTPENTYLRRDGGRQCRACVRAATQRYYARRNGGR